MSDVAVNLSLWSKTAQPGPALPVLQGIAEADLLVLGGGIAGLSAALVAREQGQEVVVLDAAEPGEAASGRSGGQVIAGLRHHPSELIARYGQDWGARAFAFGAETATRTFELIARHNLEAGADPTGWIQAAQGEAAVAESRRRVESWQRAGAPVEFLDRDGMAQMTGTNIYDGGWFDARGGGVQPLSFARALAAKVVELSGRIYARSPALKLERVGAVWQAQTPMGQVKAKAVIVTTHATNHDFWPGLRAMILPVWSFQIATAPLNADLRARILPRAHVISDTRNIASYFRLDPQARLVIGGKGTMFGPKRSADFAVQHRMLARLYPALANLPIEHRWGGRVAITLDRFPRIIRLGPHGFASLGCNGKGIAWSTALGEPLAQAALGDDPMALPLPLSPIQPIPLPALRRFYVGLGSAWLKLRDAMNTPEGRGLLSMKGS